METFGLRRAVAGATVLGLLLVSGCGGDKAPAVRLQTNQAKAAALVMIGAVRQPHLHSTAVQTCASLLAAQSASTDTHLRGDWVLLKPACDAANKQDWAAAARMLKPVAAGLSVADLRGVVENTGPTPARTP